MTKKPEPMLWLSDARGVYIPRDFANSFIDRDKHITGIRPEAWTVLENGPEEEWYWDEWQYVLDNAIVAMIQPTTPVGHTIVRYRLHQDGDLWLIPEGMSWSEEDGFTWHEEHQLEEDLQDYETAARALGWTRGGDHPGFIYNTNDYDSWKAAASWAPEHGSLYDSWKECCEAEAIDAKEKTEC